MKSDETFLNSLQRNIAFLCVDISVLRNQSAAGSVEKCRRFCSSIDLTEFFAALKDNYAEYLNVQTDLLCNYCKTEKLQFGSARKVLNIFFRHICYNGFMQREYLHELDLYSNNSILASLELPVDSRVANCLSNERWISIKNMDRLQHQKYQDLAQLVAADRGVARIHLDIEYWTPL